MAVLGHVPALSLYFSLCFPILTLSKRGSFNARIAPLLATPFSCGAKNVSHEDEREVRVFVFLPRSIAGELSVTPK
uniref:Putative secreted protein n=1 Tax=Anopheles darlingi TaxID=43151 RepID=A0A2M4DDQ7_ANODA